MNTAREGSGGDNIPSAETKVPLQKTGLTRWQSSSTSKSERAGESMPWCDGKAGPVGGLLFLVPPLLDAVLHLGIQDELELDTCQGCALLGSGFE